VSEFNLLTTCSIAAVSRCRFVVMPGTNIGGGAGCLVLPSVSACHRGSELQVVVT
jgi:hypothetical protein